jgi:signal transduction histidine kinase
MQVRQTLVGVLRLDRGVEAEASTGQNRSALISTFARLGALVLERERLLCEREEAHARELALRETTAHMETFLGVAAHELKTPLTSMKLSLQVAERRMRRLVQRETIAGTDLTPSLDHLAQSMRQVERLDRLVNELLDVSRVRVGKLDLHLQSADVAVIVREAVEQQRQVNPERMLLLHFPADLAVPVVVDADRLGQVVTNYLTNALKYSPTSCPVTVGLDVDARRARVWVRDEGPGLPPEEQERIWERFERIKGIEVQSGSGIGLGLGLYICRSIIERHQGQVGIESTPGQGSAFWFTVPLAPATER